jgi:hypothetical protein
MWGVGWDINGLAGAHGRFFAPKSEFELAFEEGKGFLKIVAMGSRAAAGCSNTTLTTNLSQLFCRNEGASTRCFGITVE